MNIAESYDYEGVEIRIYYDENGGSDPRDYDNLATLVCWHTDYVLGDYQITDGGGRGAVGKRYVRDDFGSMRALARYIGVVQKGVCIVPLYLYDHSGISISAGTVNPFDNPTIRRDEFGRGLGWDTSMVGFAYSTHERVSELCGGGEKYHSEKWIAEQIQLEVDHYDSYLSGEIYGFIVDKDGEDEDSCWGFVGDIDYCKEEANAVAGAVAKTKAHRAIVNRMYLLDPEAQPFEVSA